MKLLVFGPVSGYSSYPVVMRGLIHAFRELGLDPIVADISGAAGDLDKRSIHELSLGRLPAGLEVDVVFAMKPSLQFAQLTQQGCKLIGLHVGDVSEVPSDWKAVMALESLIVVPSRWMAAVVRAAMGDGAAPVAVSAHGIEREYLDAPYVAPPDGGPFRWLHLCSAGVYPERKGTPQVLDAFQQASSGSREATLTLVVSEVRRRLRKLLAHMDDAARKRVLIYTRPMGMTAEQMIELYQSHHALLAPSRSEGFGITALEARAVGRPVVQTMCTGHADHGLVFRGQHGDVVSPMYLAECGVVPVDYGDIEPAWGDFGRAPTVAAVDVVRAMEHCVKHYDELLSDVRESMQKMHIWSWVETTRQLVEKLKEVGEK